jgi:Glycosyl hydrolases family 35/Beta-galactosidase, domain 2
VARALALVAAVLALTLGGASAARADAPAPGASLGLGRPHTIGWDSYSLRIDGNRLVVWSGEFHYFRLPSPSLWPDVLQKIKADGFNTVQLYFSWAYHSPKQGVYDFSGIRDIDKLLDDAEDAGLYVLARPGPYINAETDAGGLPDWILADNPLRTHAPCTEACPGYGSYLSQAEDWLHRVDAIVAKHQLTTGGGSVIGYQIENELQETGTDRYMADLAAQVRRDGISVPLYFNDPGIAGRFVPSGAGGSGGDRAAWNDLYGYDDYPNGFFCTNPTQWSPAPDRESAFRVFDTNTPIFSPEFQGGSIDLWGGSGYDNCRRMTGPDFERVFEQTNFANGLTMESNYMTYGGTSWGYLPSPGIVYTSYDYGAAITEGRQLTAKYNAQKEIGYFLGSVAPLSQTDAAPPVTAANVSPPDATACSNGTGGPALTDCGAIKVYHRVNPTTGTGLYFARHNESRSTVDSTFNVPISTPDGAYTVPQHGTLELNGRDMKTIVADDDLDSAATPQQPRLHDVEPDDRPDDQRPGRRAALGARGPERRDRPALRLTTHCEHAERHGAGDPVERGDRRPGDRREPHRPLRRPHLRRRCDAAAAAAVGRRPDGAGVLAPGHAAGLCPRVGP